MNEYVKNQEVFDKVEELFGKLSPSRKDGVFIVHDVAEPGAGGILVSAQGDYRYATVLSTGRCVKAVKPGDRIVIGKFYGTKLDLGRGVAGKVLFVSEDQIDALVI